MILPMHKVLILIAWRSSAEFVMRLLSKSKGGCEQSGTWFKVLALWFMTGGDGETAEGMSEVRRGLRGGIDVATMLGKLLCSKLVE